MPYVVGTVKPEDKVLVSLTEVNEDGSVTGFSYQEEELKVSGMFRVDANGRLLLDGYKPDKALEPSSTPE